MSSYPGIWKCLLGFLGASPIAVLEVYLVFSILLGVNWTLLFGPSVASCAATMMLGIAMFFAWRRRALKQDIRPTKVALMGYILTLTVIDVYYAVVFDRLAVRRGTLLFLFFVVFYGSAVVRALLSEPKRAD